jgi:hypothetical protein
MCNHPYAALRVASFVFKDARPEQAVFPARVGWLRPLVVAALEQNRLSKGIVDVRD